MNEPRCPKCKLFTDHFSGPLGPQRCPYDRLREAVGDVSPEEDRQLHWLAGGDYSTVDVLETLFKRLRAGKPPGWLAGKYPASENRWGTHRGWVGSVPPTPALRQCGDDNPCGLGRCVGLCYADPSENR